MPAGFHSHPYACSPCLEIAVKLLCFLTVLESTLLELPTVRIHKRNLLKARMVIRSYNDHCSAPFSRALAGWHHQSLIGRGSRHCYAINFTNNSGSTHRFGVVGVIAFHEKAGRSQVGSFVF